MSKGKKLILPGVIVLLALVLLLSGCGSRLASKEAPVPREMPAAPVPVQEGARSFTPSANVVQKKGQASGSSSMVDLETEKAAAGRKIIYTDNLHLVVKDSKRTVQQIREQVAAAGGYVAKEHTWLDNGQTRASMTLRVPLGQFDTFLEQLRQLALRVDDEQLSTQDVTDRYVDLNARLRNLETTEKELQALLSDVRKRTQRASDVMDVYRELSNVRGQIEQVKGQMQMLEKLTTFTTINVTITPDALSRPIVKGPWRPAVTLHNALSLLSAAVRALAQLTIYIIVFVLPIIILIAIPIYFLFWIVRWVFRKRRRPSPTGLQSEK